MELYELSAESLLTALTILKEFQKANPDVSNRLVFIGIFYDGTPHIGVYALSYGFSPRYYIHRFPVLTGSKIADNGTQK